MYRVLFAAALFALPPSVALANCPIGSFPWTDLWGNQICKRFGDGSTGSIQGSLDNCPVGTHPWTDMWGNRTCRSLSGAGQYYDTSQGCPIGTMRWTDMWGNAVCKRF
jgi:hypothetical protein